MPGPDHGPRLSEEAFTRAMVNLYRGLPPVPSRRQETAVRRKELDLTIDHRLGSGFPAERREALWVVQQRLERRRLWLLFKYSLRRILPWNLLREAPKLARFVLREYESVLGPEEMMAYFGEEEVKHPALPVEPEALDED